MIKNRFSTAKKVDCYKCIYFYVTWDINYPRGCKIMGFKSTELPSTVVSRASGMHCLHFVEKKKL